MITVFVPCLPRDVLRQSGGPAKDRGDVAEAMKELMADTSHALADLGAGLPEYARARVSVLYLVGARRRDKRYRPMRVDYAIPALRGVYEALVDARVIPSTSPEHFVLGEHRVLEGQEREGLHVFVEEIE